MKVLSLFDGISCGMVALERANIPVERYVAYEYDEETASKEAYKSFGSAAYVGSYNYPMIEQKGDVFKGDYSLYKGFDLLIGGSPCTYWSIAKAGGEREKTSSGLGFDLFMQYVRALKEAKPKWFLYENNESMSDEIKEEITKQLGVSPLLIDSADFSAQIRKRYYWTNIPVVLDYTPKDQKIEDIIFDDTYKVKDFEKYESSKIVSKDGETVKWDTSGKGYYSQQNRARSKKLKMNTVTACGRDKCNIWLGGTKYRYMHPVEAERLQTLPDNYTSILQSDAQRIKAVGNGWTVDVIAHIFKNLPNE